MAEHESGVAASGAWFSAALPMFDFLTVVTSTVLAYFLRFQGRVPGDFIIHVAPVAIIATVVFMVLFWAFRLYRQVWRYAGVEVLVKLAWACGIAFVIGVALDVVLTDANGQRPAPIGTLFITTAFVFMGAGAIRLYGRLISYAQGQAPSQKASVLIVGAGDAGSLLLRDVEQHPDLGIRVVGFLDDDTRLHGRYIHGVPVLGAIDTLGEVVGKRQVDEVLLAIPSSDSAERRRILDICSSVGVRTRLVPHLTAGTQPAVSGLRGVEVEDLLGRDPVVLELEEVRRGISGKKIAVTGAAGSIGSELCRQIAFMEPAELHLLEIDETRLYEVYLELRDIAPIEPVMHICDIRDDRKLTELFMGVRPDVVIHAAAYKHVPLMEIAPDEAIKTNVGGTRNVLGACEAAKVARFVLISTDKAVAPTTIMGMTKAIAERMTMDACRRGLNACAVRFGNVLGSRGSVIPLFQEQIKRGGPLKVTHPEVTRFFMTIPEAARLVLEAQSLSDGGDIYVLEMGEPVKIVDLAQKMIILSGLQVKIEYTGLRPAEKLHEVLTETDEALIDTGLPKIQAVSSIPVPSETLEEEIRRLSMYARTDDRAGMTAFMMRLMPDVPDLPQRLLLEPRGSQPGAALDPEMETLF